ncbi:Hint domain-containing protein [Ruegeria halocynthiae]|uniref:Hint domain-containing protein n=1 Tax=Ruegeria halocynthiae TaxID=985054 RepID=A0A1H3AAT6_9RHOB|nr:Hint domain-containing protein [Ruegeria halocynthiae]SDX26571.1 Hint domain-containing protein [Ruegeria halocynthiae]
MANYSYIGYAPGVISVSFTGFSTGTITLSGSYDPDTDRRVFDVEDAAGGTLVNGDPDNGTDFNGDRFNNEVGDDLTQNGVVTNLDGSVTFDSGAIYLEESYSLTNPSGGTIDVFRVEVEGNLVGYITSEPLTPGTAYSFVRSNVTPDNAPDTTDPGAIVDVPCFAAGTMIATPEGDKPIETLAKGDLVLTADLGPQPIRWIGARSLTGAELAAAPRLRPITIRAGALGAGLPLRDLKVSPQHRMLVRSTIAVRMFNAQEVLIPANKLVGVPGITVDDSANGVTYYHMLFDRHEIITAEGAPSESLFTGPEALKSVGAKARAEIIELFPELGLPGHAPGSARHIPTKGKQASHMVRRHLKNDQPLIDRI